MSPNNNSSEALQVVLVAGGTGGLGAAVSLAFLRRGSHVIVTYQKQAELATLEEFSQRSWLALGGLRR